MSIKAIINAITNSKKCTCDIFNICVDCNKILTKMERTYELYDGRKICEYDLNNQSSNMCDECGRFVLESDFYNGHLVTTSEGDVIAFLCPNCAKTVGGHVIDNSHIYNYGYKPEAIFHGTPLKSRSGDIRMYFGIEYEIDTDKDTFDYDNRNKMSQELYRLSSGEELFYQKEDGSLDGGNEHGGIENVFHPMDIDFINNSTIFEEVCATANKYGYNNQKGTAGIHIHASRAAFGKDENYQLWNISKMVYCFDKFWDSLIMLVNRTKTYYCFKPSIEVAKMTNHEYEQAVLEKCNNHYCSINNQNKNTVEFRIFNSTTEAWRIKAYVQLINVMFKFVEKRNFRQLANVTLEQVLESDYPELNRLMSEYTSRNN